MKKTVYAMIGMVAIVLFLSSTGLTQDVEKRFGLGARLSYLSPEDDSIDDVKVEPDDTFLFEGNLTYFFTRSLSLEFLIGYTKPDVDAVISGITVDFGELEQIPLLLTGHYHFWINPNSSIYLGAGIGYYLNDFSLSGLVRSIDPNLNIEADDSFGYHINAGFETFVAENTSLNADFKYIWNEADFTSKEPGIPDETSEVDLDSFVIGVGVKYYF